MSRRPVIAPKKQPRQARAIATVAAIVEAATYILRRGGLAEFTTNKVAERAGVNIASFYQYFPNKEALLFEIARRTWDEQFARLEPILTGTDGTPAKRLHRFIRELMLVEAAEAELRRGLRAASVELRETPEYADLIARGSELFRQFLSSAIASEEPGDLAFIVEASARLITSFVERTTDEVTAESDLLNHARFLADLLTIGLRVPEHLLQR